MGAFAVVVMGITGVVAGEVAAIAGFGIGGILTPLLAIWIGTKLAVAAVAIPHAGATALRFAMMREHLDRRVLFTFGGASALSGLIGAFAAQSGRVPFLMLPVTLPPPVSSFVAASIDHPPLRVEVPDLLVGHEVSKTNTFCAQSRSFAPNGGAQRFRGAARARKRMHHARARRPHSRWEAARQRNPLGMR